jgi:hypothetical protein
MRIVARPRIMGANAEETTSEVTTRVAIVFQAAMGGSREAR